jgi:uncharacterized protein
MLKRQKNGEYSNPIKIRAHHLLCIQGFQGHGYSRDFERNMTRTIQKIESYPEQELEIVAECDEICSHCPHQVERLCEMSPGSDISIRKLDAAVLKRLDLEEKTIIKASNILELVNIKLETLDILDICGNCFWREMCLWYREKIEPLTIR